MQPKRLSEPRACADEYGGSGSYCLVLLDALAGSPSASPPRKEGSYPKTSTATLITVVPVTTRVIQKIHLVNLST